MRIHPRLKENVELNPTKESSQENLDLLCQKIDSRVITLPLYQRDLSWTTQKSVDLLNYQLSGKSPVSAISINVIDEVSDSVAVPQVTFINRELVDLKSGMHSVVDGQKRLTTNYKAYIDSEDFKSIVLDLCKGKFVYIGDNTFPQNNQIPVGILLNKDGKKLTEYLKTHKSLAVFEVQDILVKVRNKFKSYYYTINKAHDLSEEEQIRWFEVLNNAGSRVSAVQMGLSKLRMYGIDVYTQYTHVFVEKLKEHGFESVFDKETTKHTYPICALNAAYEVIMGTPHSNNYCPMASDVRVNAICSMKASQILLSFKYTLDALDKVIDFIENNDLDIPSRIDYINFLIGYFVFYQREDKVDEQFLINWYNTVNFSNSSNTERRKIYSKLLSKTL